MYNLKNGVEPGERCPALAGMGDTPHVWRQLMTSTYQYDRTSVAAMHREEQKDGTYEYYRVFYCVHCLRYSFRKEN